MTRTRTAGCASGFRAYPTRESPCEKLEIPPTAVGGLFRYSLYVGAPGIPVFPLLPPLAARGEEVNKTKGAGGSLRRLGLNNPPTAVGGIPGVSHSFTRGG